MSRPNSEIAALVCDRCWNKVFATNLWKKALRREYEPMIKYDVSLGQILSAIGSGCNWCRYLYSQIGPWESINHHNNYPPLGPLALLHWLEGARNLDADKAALYDLTLEDRCSVRLSSISWGPDVTPKGCLGFALEIEPQISRSSHGGARSWVSDIHTFADAGDPAAAYVPARPIHTNVDTRAATDQIRTWLYDCTSHPNCSVPAQQSLPTRLLQVSPEPRLVTTAGQLGQYLALSYRWGPPNDTDYLLTTANIASRLKGMDIESMPRSIRDAVHVTRTAGHQYLWIDALCIMQDSSEDKANELILMDQIYGKALMTIVASCAVAVQDGFLAPRQDFRMVYRLPFWCTEHDMGSIYVESSDQNHIQDSDEPISKRAWALQEKILSPRLLVYATHTLQWRCRTIDRNLGDYIHNPVFHVTGLITPSSNVFSNDGADRTSQAGPSFTKEPADGCLVDGNVVTSEIKNWTDIVTDYSSRECSDPDDKLTALAGIVAAFPRRPDSVYLAGFWSSFLVQQLLWWRASTHVNTRPPSYRAPTWSWASIEGGVLFLLRKYPSCNDEVYRCTVVDCRVTLRSAKLPYGEVTDGYLKAKGVLFKGWLQRRRGDHGYSVMYGSDLAVRQNRVTEEVHSDSHRDPDSDPPLDDNPESDDEVAMEWRADVMATGIPDTKDDIPSRWVQCLALSRNWTGIRGLMLVPSGSHHRRVGYFWDGKKADFDGQPEREITII